MKRFGEDQAGVLAALVAYFGFISLFPLLLVFTTIVGFVVAHDPERQQQVVDSALASFPVIGEQIRSNIGTVQGSGVALVVGLAVALWGGLGAIAAMQTAMNAIWQVPRGEWPAKYQQIVRSLAMLAGFAVSVGLSTATGGVATALRSWPLIGRILVLVPALVLNSLLFLWAFRVLTRRRLSWDEVWPGAVTAGVFLTAVQAVGGFYVNHVIARAGPLYGSFAVVLGLLTLLYVQAQLSLLAAEVNVVRAFGLWPRSLIGDGTDAPGVRTAHGRPPARPPPGAR